MNFGHKKWLIEPKTPRTKCLTQEYWETIHVQKDYSNVWGITGDKNVRDKIISKLAQLGVFGKILIPGCGSRGYLESDIASSYDSVSEIVCTDFPGVVKKAQSKSKHGKIIYASEDSTNLPYSDVFSCVINVNAVLSDSDTENRNMLKSFYEALLPGGYFVGFFPTIFCPVDVAYLDETRDWLNLVDIANSTLHEPKQDTSQIFYTPLRLRHILNEVGFTLCSMEIYFFDSPFMRQETKRYYDVKDQDLVVYEHFIVCQKV